VTRTLAQVFHGAQASYASVRDMPATAQHSVAAVAHPGLHVHL
jgi:hypothetical protein